jgi:nucleoside-diphosphate-sugar epimerase
MVAMATHVAACVKKDSALAYTQQLNQEGCNMRIFVAGVGGAIGPPLIAAMVRHGHTVTGMNRAEAGMQQLVDMGVTVAIVHACDRAAVEQAQRRSQAEVVIDQLTA